ncbi:uncharacterized protein KY384_004549 [Bacidia gigantensis]|uniref:uncharacterized protein n=1 Tax=Bacidia gigantensis TaxID=2732470 RepID=UPI001D0479D5|nr:uncharacterized protein KY384_004549 [Bacidia gigantensis]KAG8531191.1 hypothetical protein KY384_004549 [Bacidia gigantensis]
MPRRQTSQNFRAEDYQAALRAAQQNLNERRNAEQAPVQQASCHNRSSGNGNNDNSLLVDWLNEPANFLLLQHVHRTPGGMEEARAIDRSGDARRLTETTNRWIRESYESEMGPLNTKLQQQDDVYAQLRAEQREDDENLRRRGLPVPPYRPEDHEGFEEHPDHPANEHQHMNGSRGASSGRGPGSSGHHGSRR